MIDVNSNDSVPGETEILALAANYMAARLFTPRQINELSVLIDVTKQPMRVPVTRAMLAPQKAAIGTKPPTSFAMTVSTAAGLRDAAETVAHELLHISQSVNGRLGISMKKTKVNGRRQIAEMARWMGGKPVVMDSLAWHLRPWEVEACHWQARLVEEFLGMSTGQVSDQPVQLPKRRQLALYPVTMQAPAMAEAYPEPTFDGVVASGNGGGASDALSPVDSNGESIDRVINGALALEPAANGALAESRARQAPEPTQPESAEAVNGGVVGAHAQDDSIEQDSAPLAALPDTPVYTRPVMEIMVPGLDAPRTLERQAIMNKLAEFRQRGLAEGFAEDQAENQAEGGPDGLADRSAHPSAEGSGDGSLGAVQR